MKPCLAGLACFALLTACSPPDRPAPKAADAAANYTELPVTELMVHVVDPAAQAFWSGAGSELTQKGERDLSPTTDAGWKHVEDGAAALVEAGNLLKLPGRPRAPTDRWNAHAQVLTALALEAQAAADKRDKAQLLEIGIRLDTACDACHSEFRPAPK